MMQLVDWTSITFLESSENLKPRLKALTGRTPNSSIAKEIGICLQQGRLFFQSAQESAIEIRPLLLFYGTMAFSKAIAMGSQLSPLATLPQTHGVNDVSTQNASIDELSVKIGARGTFQLINDAVAKLNRMEYIDKNTMTQSFDAFTTPSNALSGVTLTLKDILGRIPELQPLYIKTFDELTNCINFQPFAGVYNDDEWELRFSTSRIFKDISDIEKIVTEMRSSFPILKNFKFACATRAWNSTYLDFSNMPVPEDEFTAQNFRILGNEYRTKDSKWSNSGIKHTPITAVAHPHEGSFSGSNYLISPVQGQYIAVFSLQYLGMFLLSSMVRYRPQIWVSALRRSPRPDGRTDDKALSLLEQFMASHLRFVPSFVSEIFNAEKL